MPNPQSTQKREPTAFELARYQELFQRDPLEAVQFAVAKSLNISADTLSDAHEITDANLGSHELLRAHADPEIAKRAQRTKEARYLLEHGKTIQDELTEAIHSADSKSVLFTTARVAREWGLEDIAIRADRKAVRLAEQAEQEQSILERKIREAGGSDAARDLLSSIQSGEHALRRKYGLNRSTPDRNGPHGEDSAPAPEVVRLYEQERGELHRKLHAEHAKKIDEIKKRVLTEVPNDAA